MASKIARLRPKNRLARIQPRLSTQELDEIIRADNTVTALNKRQKTPFNGFPKAFLEAQLQDDAINYVLELEEEEQSLGTIPLQEDQGECLIAQLYGTAHPIAWDTEQIYKRAETILATIAQKRVMPAYLFNANLLNTYRGYLRDDKDALVLEPITQYEPRLITDGEGNLRSEGFMWT